MRRPSHKLLVPLVLVLSLVLGVAGAWAAIRINEIRTDNPGVDTDEYFEISGPAGTFLTGYTYITIGDASSGTNRCGAIESITTISSLQIRPDGFLCALRGTVGAPTLAGYDTAYTASDAFENSDNVTHMLVQGFTGTAGQDLDTNDDGVFDIMPWTTIVDAVSLRNNKIIRCDGVAGYYTEHFYAATVLGPDPSKSADSCATHVYRCSDTGLWTIGNHTLAVFDTPGEANFSCAAPPPTFAGANRETRSPCVPFTGQTAAARARARNSTGANIHYKVNGGSETVAGMTLVGTSGDTATYEYVLPAQAVNGTLVEYYAKAFNALPDTVKGFDQGYFVGTKTIRPLYVNDVNGSNLYRFYGVRINGVVTMPYPGFQVVNMDYYMQDATGGINVFKNLAHSEQPGLGDDITVTGVLSQFSGKLEITESLTCDTLLVEINGPGTLPSPQITTTCDDFEAIEGNLLAMYGLKLPAGTDTLRANTNYRVTNCHADTLIMRIDGDTNIDPMPVTSLYCNVKGIAVQLDSNSPFTAGYEVLPRFASDITFVNAVTGLEDPARQPTARLLQNSPNPWSRSTEIRYEVPAAAAVGDLVKVKLSIFDLQGRLVKAVVNGLQEPGDHALTLTDEAFGNAGSGIYFYRLEVGNEVLTRRLLRLNQ